jgi:hypothetical protein
MTHLGWTGPVPVFTMFGVCGLAGLLLCKCQEALCFLAWHGMAWHGMAVSLCSWRAMAFLRLFCSYAAAHCDRWTACVWYGFFCISLREKCAEAQSLCTPIHTVRPVWAKSTALCSSRNPTRSTALCSCNSTTHIQGWIQAAHLAAREDNPACLVGDGEWCACAYLGYFGRVCMHTCVSIH